MSVSLGVAAASLIAAVFVPDRFRAGPLEMISGIHKAFVVLGLLTVISALIFRELRSADGVNVSRHLPVTNDSLARRGGLESRRRFGAGAAGVSGCRAGGW
jgi:hypothetical protein